MHVLQIHCHGWTYDLKIVVKTLRQWSKHSSPLTTDCCNFSYSMRYARFDVVSHGLHLTYSWRHEWQRWWNSLILAVTQDNKEMRSQGFGCSPIKKIRELGSDRKVVVKSKVRKVYKVDASMLAFYFRLYDFKDFRLLYSLNPEDQRMHTHPPLNVTCPRRSRKEIFDDTVDLYRWSPDCGNTTAVTPRECDFGLQKLRSLPVETTRQLPSSVKRKGNNIVHCP